MKKINILIISGISAIILFIVLTIVQSKLIENETMQRVFVSTRDILQDTKLTENDYKEIYVPASLVINTDAVINLNDLQEKYSKELINKGQIIFKQDISTKEELKIIDAENGLERIAVKLKSSDNAVAYQIKPKDRIHLYFTGKSNVVQNVFSTEENIDNSNLYTTLKIIEDTKILGIYDEIGRSYENSEFIKPDTIVIAVTSDNAKIINNLRSQGTFDITR